jgi:hypothetical protein
LCRNDILGKETTFSIIQLAFNRVGYQAYLKNTGNTSAVLCYLFTGVDIFFFNRQKHQRSAGVSCRGAMKAVSNDEMNYIL